MAEKRSQGNKVKKVLQKWDLQELGPELERRWLGEGYEEHSLRDLATYFNKKILTEAFAEGGVVPLESEVENFYTLLTADQMSKADEIQAEQRLSDLGVDPDELRDDFVSHQTIYRYLENSRDAHKTRKQRSTEEMITATEQASSRLTNRLKAVVQKNLEVLAQHDGFSVGDFDVYIGITVSCSDCGASHGLTQLLARDGCDCE